MTHELSTAVLAWPRLRSVTVPIGYRGNGEVERARLNLIALTTIRHGFLTELLSADVLKMSVLLRRRYFPCSKFSSLSDGRRGSYYSFANDARSDQ